MSETDETAVAGKTAEGTAPTGTDEAAAPEAPAISAEEAKELDAMEVDEAAMASTAEALEVPVGVTHANVHVCERGHRTFSVWSAPSTCRAHVNRRDECGRPLYPLGELPEQIQKALNPLKASKKSSKKG